ncbi:outer membrane protein assembly factor [Neolewinella antarctica]|uniref:Phosphodiesterase n=1 Tax=Neolewinella antarctica TaxID=442734 RepID=A0ABX0X674_9BACT|nr:hypothetical protein [Neolewinella antarctica]NJC24637.1 putative phosphodiesterase [Neolewinella antarctica]
MNYSLPKLRLFPLAILTLFLSQCANYQQYVDDQDGLVEVETPTGSIDYSTFMVGDLGYDYERGLTTLDAMVRAMPGGKKKSSLLLLGDITGKNGLAKNGGDEEAHLRAIGTLLGKVPGKVYYTPGENELGRNSDFSRLDRLEDFFDDNIDKKVKFMPNNACSGPDDEQLHKNVGLIGFNTAWYLADWSRDDEVSEGCDFTERDAATLALADEIKGYRDQVKIVMMHHTLQSNGNRGGKYSTKQHLFPLADIIPGAYIPLPIIGSVIRAVQSVSGGQNDVNSLLYRQMISKIKAGIDDEVNVIFVTGHEHDMFLAHEGEYVKINAGSGSVYGPSTGGNDANFAYGAVGYSRLDFYDSGEVFVGFYEVDKEGVESRVFYRRIIENRNTQQDNDIKEVPTEVISERVVKTSVYGTDAEEKSAFGKRILGRHYRPLYFQDIEVPVLMIDTVYGGLRPYRRGGGMTTMSLHTEGADGHLYQLRSVRKNPAQLLPSMVEKTFAADIVKDQFTAIHPYAPLTLPPMQQALGLYGADPYLFYIPKQPALGDFNTNFGGEMYWVEQRPDEDWSGTRFFGGSKDIISNSKMRELMADSWKNYPDQENYARARLFDLFIGDWDRHRDQWRWASFPEEDGRTRYVAVGRDRDQVYGNYDGLLLGLARVFVPEARKVRPFTGELDKARWRGMNGKWNDRVFLNQITREQMIAEAKFIQNTLTDEIIDEAMAKFPEEVMAFSLEREEIGIKLKSRLKQLDRFAEEYYYTLAESVNILATDQDDVIKAVGLENGDLTVQVFDADKEGKADEMYFSRTFHKEETKDVVIYGLDGDDHFEISGAESPIRLRLTGGTDGDEVIASGDLKARVYDEKKGMDVTGTTGNLMDRRSDNHPELNQFNFTEYYPNYTVPIPALGFNVDDGFFLGAGFTTTIQGHKPDPYRARYGLLAKYSSNEFFTVNGDLELNGIFGRRNDLVVAGHFFSDGYVANYFGLGNRSTGAPDEGVPILLPGDEELTLEDDQILDYNRARRREINISPMLRLRGKRNRVQFSIGPFFESYDLSDDIDDFALITLDRASGKIPDRVFDEQNFGGLQASFSSNNVAIPLLADNGIRYDIYAKQSFNLDDSDLTNTKIGGNFTLYKMLKKAINISTRIGIEHNEGSPEFYQLAVLGGRTNYRAARAERYRGNTAFYQNIDLRFMGFSFGKSKEEVSTVGGFILGLDYGRVWLDGEANNGVWHVGYGGGVWMAPLGASIFSLTYFRDSDDARIAFAAGWPF